MIASSFAAVSPLRLPAEWTSTSSIDACETRTPVPRWSTGAEAQQHLMHARFYAAGSGRFLSVDPRLDALEALHAPQQWNRYVYAGNNPIRFFDEDGRSKRSFFVKTVKGIWKEVEEKVAVLIARRGEKHVVRVEGPAASRGARRVGELAHEGEELVRHDAHIPGGEPHWQPKRRKGGHVGYTILGGIATAASFLPYIGDFVETDPLGEGGDANPVFDSAAEQIYGVGYYELTEEERADVRNAVSESQKEKQKKPENDPNKDYWCRECPRSIFGIPIW